MPASLFGDRLITRQPAWHRLGTVMDTTGINASEAARIADILFPIVKLPAPAQAPLVNPTVTTSTPWGQFGKPQPTASTTGTELIDVGRYYIARSPVTEDPTYRILSPNTVSKQWTPIQTSELAQILDPLTEKYPVETAGALGHGERIFFTLDAGEGIIAGEDHKLYYLVTDHRDGTGALSIAFTPVRVVCQNTLTVGLASAKVHTSIHHTEQIHEDAKWYMNLFQNMMDSRTSVVNTMNQLSEVTITDEEAQALLKSTYPDPVRSRKLQFADSVTPDDLNGVNYLTLLNDKKEQEDKREQAIKNATKKRNEVWELYDIFNQEHPNVSRTAWAIWQAVVEAEDYRRGKDTQVTQQAILFGSRGAVKHKAFASALELAEAR